MMRRWTAPGIRDDVVATVEKCVSRAEDWSLERAIARVGLARGRFYQWRRRRGAPNRHNAPIPKDGWLLDWEKNAIVDFHFQHPGEGYRRLTWMMVDEDVVAVGPASVWKVLKNKGLFDKWSRADSKKRKGFVQPLKPHEHWHSDISYLNIAGTFYYFFGLVDGASRYLVHWEIRESMKETDLEIVIERAKGLHPQARPRIISDNGPQYVSHEFREFIRVSGMTHVRISPYYPQSNGKIERFHKSLKSECTCLPAGRSAPEHPSRWKTPAAWSPSSSTTTTTRAFTAPSATSRQQRWRRSAGRMGVVVFASDRESGKSPDAVCMECLVFPGK